MVNVYFDLSALYSSYVTWSARSLGARKSQRYETAGGSGDEAYLDTLYKSQRTEDPSGLLLMDAGH